MQTKARYPRTISRDQRIKILRTARRRDESVGRERYREYQWAGVSPGWRINKLSARVVVVGPAFTGGPTGRTFISAALYTGNQWDVIPSSNSLATARRRQWRWWRRRVRGVCARPFGIIIIHKLINRADNIADVSRMSIRLGRTSRSRGRSRTLAAALISPFQRWIICSISYCHFLLNLAGRPYSVFVSCQSVNWCTTGILQRRVQKKTKRNETVETFIKFLLFYSIFGHAPA